MKKITILSHIFIFLFVFIILFSVNFIITLSTVPFEYNVMPSVSNNSIVDTKVQKELTFKLYEPVDKIYYENESVKIEDNTFKVNVSKLTGYKTLTFTNSSNETVSYSYYFSDKKGKVDDYELIKGKELVTYVTTYRNIRIIYTSKEKSAAKKLVNHLKKLPDTLLNNLTTITMIPYETTGNIAGITKNNTITLYKFSKYSTSVQKNILYHEIAHTWATLLMQYKVIDYSYTNYATAVNADHNYVSSYSKSYIQEKNSYNEDFADSIAFFLINKKSFKKKYPNRYEYINTLIKFD